MAIYKLIRAKNGTSLTLPDGSTTLYRDCPQDRHALLLSLGSAALEASGLTADDGSEAVLNLHSTGFADTFGNVYTITYSSLSKPTTVPLFDKANLRYVDVSQWDTSAVTSMQSLFSGCSQLKELDVSQWNTSAVTSMVSLFSGCSQLKELDVSRWNTSAVTSMVSLFYGCSQLKELDVSRWDTSAVTNMQYLFYGCSQLKEPDVSRWDTSMNSDLYQTFYLCWSLESLDLSGWDASSAYRADRMLHSCTSLTTLLGGDETKTVCLKGLKVSLDLSSCPLDRASAVAVMNGAATITTGQKLTFSASTKALLSADDIAIATKKGWTVA